jgi:hypothetical protein
VTRDTLQLRSDRLAARVEALASALHASGVPEEASVALLSHASAAVLDALTLELLLEERDSAAGPQRDLELAVRLAA